MKQFVSVIFVAFAVSTSALPGNMTFLPGDKPLLPGGKQASGWGWAWVPTTPDTTTPVTTTPVTVGNICIPVYSTADTCTSQDLLQLDVLLGAYLGLKKKEEFASAAKLTDLDVFLASLGLFGSCTWSSLMDAGYPVTSSPLFVALNVAVDI